MTGADTLPAAGQATPAAAPDSPGGRLPAQLNDPAWLTKSLAVDGERVVARTLGIARGTLRAAMEFHGIPAQPVGRRRGVFAGTPTARTDTLTPAASRILRRAARDRTPATAGRALHLFADADRARRDHNRLAERAAWEQLAAHAIRMVEHLDAVLAA